MHRYFTGFVRMVDYRLFDINCSADSSSKCRNEVAASDITSHSKWGNTKLMRHIDTNLDLAIWIVGHVLLHKPVKETEAKKRARPPSAPRPATPQATQAAQAKKCRAHLVPAQERRYWSRATGSDRQQPTAVQRLAGAAGNAAAAPRN